MKHTLVVIGANYALKSPTNTQVLAFVTSVVKFNGKLLGKSNAWAVRHDKPTLNALLTKALASPSDASFAPLAYYERMYRDMAGAV